MPLPVVPLDSPNEKQHRTVIATSLNELVKFFNTIESEAWTPVVRGSGTAGTYEIGTNLSRYSRIGRRVFLDLNITLAGAITAGGTGDLNITGAPYAKAANTYPIGALLLVRVNWTAAANQVLAFGSTASSSTLLVQESNDDASNTIVPISGVAATDSIIGSICYETDDP